MPCNQAYNIICAAGLASFEELSAVCEGRAAIGFYGVCGNAIDSYQGSPLGEPQTETVSKAPSGADVEPA